MVLERVSFKIWLSTNLRPATIKVAMNLRSIVEDNISYLNDWILLTESLAPLGNECADGQKD